MAQLSWYNKYTSPYTWFNSCPTGSSLHGWDNGNAICKTEKTHKLALEEADYNYPTASTTGMSKKSKKLCKSRYSRNSRYSKNSRRKCVRKQSKRRYI